MAAKEYKVTLPGGTVVVTWANSAEQAARRAERDYGTGHVVTQRGYVSNVVKRRSQALEEALWEDSREKAWDKMSA